jgi:hypothetical protein
MRGLDLRETIWALLSLSFAVVVVTFHPHQLLKSGMNFGTCLRSKNFCVTYRRSSLTVRYLRAVIKEQL